MTDIAASSPASGSARLGVLLMLLGMVMFSPYVLAVHPSLPVKTFPELIAYAKANPGPTVCCV